MTRLIQIKNGNMRRVALVEEPNVRFLDSCSSICEIAQIAIDQGKRLSEVARQRAQHDTHDYDAIYNGRSEWRLLPAIDHPEEPARCLVSGTGLTHVGSARGRQSMHATATEALTDSMKIFRWGVEGGRPEAGRIGIPPEWFHKGTGSSLRAHGGPLDVPSYACDGGEEAEIAGVYIIGRDGRPYRIGMVVGNEFSDHEFEKKNYLYLAGSKLRTCALGPEIVLDCEFNSIPVTATILREGAVLWTKTFRTGESEMCHSLQNIEHHHFKFEAHRRPGDIHVHFFGTDCLSFSDHIRLQDGDIMQVDAKGFGRALMNPVRVDKSAAELIHVTPLL
ncbi:MAG: AraD1 family protein [Candidatus Acidiferrum sp.]